MKKRLYFSFFGLLFGGLLLVRLILAVLAGLADESLVIVDMGLQADWYGIEVNKENPELLEKINAALKELEAEGFYEELAVKYFSAEEEAAE